jgi:hypothetical protein
MHHRIGLVCLALMLAAAAARADILPTPDHGPPLGRAGGLDFAIQSVDVEMGPANGPHYQKTLQVAVLTGCTDGQPNCALAKSRNLIGMEVLSVDGQDLQPEKGMIRQIIGAFANQAAGQTLSLELYSHASNNQSFKVTFARR